jgi:hypothetical protein
MLSHARDRLGAALQVLHAGRDLAKCGGDHALRAIELLLDGAERPESSPRLQRAAR